MPSTHQPENTLPDPGPRDKQNPDAVVNKENSEVLNSDEAQQVLNEPDNGTSTEPEPAEKERGYGEGLKDDSLTEPETKDSDDQPQFPEEEGK